MADVVDRDGKEARIAREVSKEFTYFRMEIMGIIPKLSKGDKDIPAKYWEQHAKRLREDVEPILKNIYWAQAMTMVQNGG